MNFNRPVWSFIKNRKKQSAVIVFFGMLTQLLTIIIPVSVGKYYQLAFGLSGRRAEFLYFIPATWWDTVVEFLIIFFLLIIVRYVCFFIYQAQLRSEAEYFIKSVKDTLFQRQLAISYPVYQKKGVGKYLLRYSGDLNSLKNVYIKGGLSVIADVFIVVVAFAWFFSLSPSGAAVIVGGSLVAYAMVHWFNRRIEHYSMQKRDKSSGQLSFVSRTLHAMVSVMLMNKQETELKKFRKRSASITATAVDYHRWSVLNNGFIAFLQYAVLGVVLCLFYWQADSRIDGASLTSFILLYLTVLPVIRRLFRLTTIYKLGNISLKKLKDIFALPKENRRVGEPFKAGEPLEIVFDNVDFGYGNVGYEVDKNGHHHLRIPAEQAAETVFYALTRINECYVGTVYLNGLAIAAYQPNALRAGLSMISSKSPLLGRTVYEAITIARSEKIREASAYCLQYVQERLGVAENTRLSLDDKIGENGSSLSAWEYQLLCLVRGINTEKPILFCDELDLIPARTYRELLNEQQKTLIYCSH